MHHPKPVFHSGHSAPFLATFLSLLLAFLPACGNEKPNQVTNPTTPNPGTSWNPPPVAPTCTAGDADQDGSCDTSDPNSSDPDSDDDGNLDGMDQTPKGPGSKHSDDDGLSPLAWGLISAAGLFLAGSVVYQAAGNCDVQGAGSVLCLVSGKVKEMRFSSGTTSAPGKLMVDLENVKIEKEYFLTWGLDWGEETCEAHVVQDYTLEPSLVVGDVPDGSVVDGGFHYQPDANNLADKQQPLGTGLETTLAEGQGCDSGGVDLNCGSGKSFCVEYTEFGSVQQPIQYPEDSNSAQIAAVFQDQSGGGSGYSKDLLFLWGKNETVVKMPQQWQRSATAYDPDNPLEGKWLPAAQ